MKKIKMINSFAILLAAFVITISASNIFGQTTKITTMEKRFTDFEVKAEMWGDRTKDSNGEEKFERCRVKLFVKNTSGENIMNWIIEASFRKDLDSSSYESKTLRKGYIGKGATQEFVFQGYCGMSKDRLKVYKK